MPIFNFVQVGQSKCSGAGYISADLFFVKTYYGHRVLTDAFLDFFGETLIEQIELNNKIGWPKEAQNYATCLMMFLTMFRSVRASDIASVHAYPLQGYIIQRSIKDQAFVLCAAADEAGAGSGRDRSCHRDRCVLRLRAGGCRLWAKCAVPPGAHSSQTDLGGRYSTASQGLPCRCADDLAGC